MTHYMGIDPGTSGSIAIAYDESPEVTTHKMPDTLDGLQSLLATYQEDLAFCLIERIHAFPFDPTKNRVIKLGFDKLQKQSGMILATAALILGSDRVQEVVPRKWQRAMFCLTGGDKTITLNRAKELYPAMNIHHWNADGILIAAYCQRLHGPKNSILKDWRGV